MKLDGDCEATYMRLCDRSGFTYKRSELIKEDWSGLIVHPKFYVAENPCSTPIELPKTVPMEID